MQAPQELIQKWDVLKSKGDYIKIAEIYEAQTGTPITRQAISTAFSTNRFNDDLFAVISEYYQAKADLIAQYL